MKAKDSEARSILILSALPPSTVAALGLTTKKTVHDIAVGDHLFAIIILNGFNPHISSSITVVFSRSVKDRPSSDEITALAIEIEIRTISSTPVIEGSAAIILSMRAELDQIRRKSSRGRCRLVRQTTFIFWRGRKMLQQAPRALY
uniref:Uncharacterized protein n=1 Tax=Spongospora subterranea TaxID=70186 RepID=A0A0H5QU87_9EUKA|eukprot:CRZ05136.1 hypothetical protein [Spongospora subterranea]